MHWLGSILENIGRDVGMEDLRSGRCSSKTGMIVDRPLIPKHTIREALIAVRPVGKAVRQGVSCVLNVCLSTTLMVRYDCLYRWRDSDCAAGESVDHGVIRAYADTVAGRWFHLTER
jgi:hypothetical protein